MEHINDRRISPFVGCELTFYQQRRFAVCGSDSDGGNYLKRLPPEGYDETKRKRGKNLKVGRLLDIWFDGDFAAITQKKRFLMNLPLMLIVIFVVSIIV